MLLLTICLTVVVAACNGRRVAEMCPPVVDTAVVVYLVDEQNDLLSDVTLSYRIHGEEWQQVEEVVTGEIGLGEVAGKYEIRAEKSGYQPAITAVTVPPKENVARGVTCGVQTQNIRLQLMRVCTEPEEEVAVAVTFTGQMITAVDGSSWQPQGIKVDYRIADGNWREAHCDGGPGAIFSCLVQIGNQPLPATVTLLAARPGYPYVELTRTVTRNNNGCLIFSEPLQFHAEQSCPAESRSVQIALDTAAGDTGVESGIIYATGPHFAKKRVACIEGGENRCRRFVLDLNAFTSYQLTVEDLPHEAYLYVEDDIVFYRYDTYEIEIEHGQRQRPFNGEGVGAVSFNLTAVPDEEGCPWVALNEVTAVESAFAPFADGSIREVVDVRLQTNLLMTGLNDEPCLREPEIQAVPFTVVLPPETHLSDVVAQYYAGPAHGWETAGCSVEAGRYLCTAYLPNPVRSQLVSIKVTVAGVDTIGFQIPATSGLCIIFR